MGAAILCAEINSVMSKLLNRQNLEVKSIYLQINLQVVIKRIFNIALVDVLIKTNRLKIFSLLAVVIKSFHEKLRL